MSADHDSPGTRIRTRLRDIIFAIICSLLIPLHTLAISEDEKINLLLEEIGKSGFTFIRNGTEYGSVAAKKHLEYKLSKSPVKIISAVDFIVYIASKSSWTGTPYYIKLPSGEKITCEGWLRKKLREIENNETAPPGK